MKSQLVCNPRWEFQQSASETPVRIVQGEPFEAQGKPALRKGRCARIHRLLLLLADNECLADGLLVKFYVYRFVHFGMAEILLLE